MSQALLLFEDLTRRGVRVELLVFPDENHFIEKPRNVLQWYEQVRDFLDRHLT